MAWFATHRVGLTIGRVDADKEGFPVFVNLNEGDGNTNTFGSKEGCRLVQCL